MKQTQPPPPDLLNMPLEQLFPKRWLHHDHLQRQPRRVFIEKATVEQVWDKRQKAHMWKNCLWFQGKEKGLLLNQTQTIQLLTALRVHTVAQCVGHIVVLTPTWHNNNKTIAISAMPTDIEGEA